mmetsp:Transcript_95710/g.117291  ORF Transcript_95710/g.117291 Transcript_95710/m.117291 type:complete len:104 (+) Transcript_95710:115-426(+)
MDAKMDDDNKLDRTESPTNLIARQSITIEEFDTPKFTPLRHSSKLNELKSISENNSKKKQKITLGDIIYTSLGVGVIILCGYYGYHLYKQHSTSNNNNNNKDT